MKGRPKVSGGDIEEATPDPIPNSEVKLFGADGTAREAVWESRTLPGFFPQKPELRKQLGLLLFVRRGTMFSSMARMEPKFVAAFAAGTALTVAGATVYPLLAWPALSFALVGLGYAGLGARPFLKGPEGRHHPIATVVLAPYMAIAWLVLLMLRLRDEDPHHEVRPKLYVGRRPLRKSELPSDVSLIVDLTSEFPGLRPKGVEYICLPTLDGSAPHDVAAVRELVAKIRSHPGAVYVHCAAGHGRSVAIVASVLVAEGRAKTMEEALALIRRVRPAVGLSRSQRALVRTLGAS